MSGERGTMDNQQGPKVHEPQQQTWPRPQPEVEGVLPHSHPDLLSQDVQQTPLEKKLAHTLVLDSGPIIKNTPTVSYLLSNSHKLVTIPEVIAELRDETTRSRLETQLLPFLEMRSPKPESVKAVMDFARRTGDFSVLSKTDLRVLALAYEIEVERNGGDWRLRSAPGQKGLNGKPPGKKEDDNSIEESRIEETALGEGHQDTLSSQDEQGDKTSSPGDLVVDDVAEVLAKFGIPNEQSQEVLSVDDSSAALQAPSPNVPFEALPSGMKIEISQQGHEHDLQGSNQMQDPAALPGTEVEEEEENSDHGDEDEDDGGWITHTNIKQHQAKDTPALVSAAPLERTMQCATLTTDFAMQNVLLQMNLNLLSTQLQRIRHLKTFILRCHACFFQCKDTSKQFCPRCGKPTLTRVSCSTNSSGEFQIHLKKNMQWNNRGNRYSVPKPVTGSASGRVVQGGGKGGWGQELILTEDQKEYVTQVSRQKRAKEKDLMNEDYLPGILTGDRSRDVSRPKVGAGRNVNARKRK